MGTVFDLLDQEWRRLSGDATVAARLAEVCEAAAGAACLRDVEHFVRAASPADADRVLLALVRRAVERDQLAARTLLQMLLPGTRRLAHRWWALGDADERGAAAVAAVYRRILTYPIQRRPGRVAVNILMDAALELRRAVPRLVVVPTADPTAQADRWDEGRAVAPLHPATELADVLLDAVADGAIGSDDAQVIARSRIADDPMREIAAQRGIGARTLWRRRQRAELALRHRRAAPGPTDGLGGFDHPTDASRAVS